MCQFIFILFVCFRSVRWTTDLEEEEVEGDGLQTANIEDLYVHCRFREIL